MTKKLLQQALDALEWASDLNQVAADSFTIHDAITALREALAAPMLGPSDMVMVPREPTPEMIEAADQSDKEYSLRSFGPGTVVAQSGYDHWVAMIAAAPPAAPAPVVREPLTQDQIISLAENYEERYHRWVFICVDELEQFARAIEKAHGIGGGGK